MLEVKLGVPASLIFAKALEVGKLCFISAAPLTHGADGIWSANIIFQICYWKNPGGGENSPSSPPPSPAAKPGGFPGDPVSLAAGRGKLGDCFLPPIKSQTYRSKHFSLCLSFLFSKMQEKNNKRKQTGRARLGWKLQINCLGEQPA